MQKKVKTDRSILIVDDDEGLRNLVSKILRRSGYIVTSLGTGRDAIDSVCANPNQLILLDQRLEDMTGEEVIRGVRERGFEPEFIMVTGQGDERLAVQIMKLGAIDYLVKDGEFLGRIQNVVERVISSLDTTEELKATKKIVADREVFLQSLFDVAKDSIIVTSLDGLIISVNRRAYDMYGYSNTEFISMKISQLISAEQLDEFTQFWQQLQDDSGCKVYETMHLKKSGEIFPVEGSFAKMDIDGGRIVVYCNDISKRKQAENEQIRLRAQLNQSQKMDAVGQLAGGIAHDFNNILGGIVGAAEIMQHEPEDRGLQEEFLPLIIKMAQRGADLTKKLLAFSRKESHQKTIFDLSKVIDEVVSILGRTVDKLITISVEWEAEYYNVCGDETLIQNLFLNLGINASHAMPDGGELRFTLKNRYLDRDYCLYSPFQISVGEYIEVLVSDSGSGISSDIIAHIFEPFFTTKEQGKGTGLGLAAVYGTVQQHGGAVTVYSEIGIGTVFHVYLPVVEGGAQKIDDHNNISERGSGTILLVDDEETILRTARGLLESMGYSVLVASNGEDALTLFRTYNRELIGVILDMIMPKISGVDTFYAMKRINPNVPVIISSGFSKDANINQMKQDGLAGFINKPYMKKELNEIVFKRFSSR